MENNYQMSQIVAFVLIKKDGKYLMVQQNREDIRGKWWFPAGHVDKGETLEEGAVREAKEESGYDVKIIKELAIFQDTVERPAVHIYEAEIIGGEPLAPNDEIMSIGWFTLEEMDELPFRKEWALPYLKKLLNKPPRIGTGVIIQNEKGEVLLGKRKGSHAEGDWCFPGGKLDFGETLFECARREVKEETGLIVNECELVSVYDQFDHIESSGYQWVNIGIVAKYEGGEPQIMEPDKFEEMGWFSIDNLPTPLYPTSKVILDNYKAGKVYREKK